MLQNIGRLFEKALQNADRDGFESDPPVGPMPYRRKLGWHVLGVLRLLSSALPQWGPDLA